MSSTFSGFSIAKRGIQTARANLQITGQNMTNVNTEGYTRQHVDSYSVGPTDNNTQYAGSTLQIGNGVESTGVSQSRDPYLDIRYRKENAKVGETNTKLDTLSDVEDIVDETVNNGINTQLADLTTQLQTLSKTPSDTSLENVVKNSSLLLTKAFNNAAQQLADIRKKTTDSLQNDAVSNTNILLKNIASLNAEIKSSDISGSSALELRDQRNTMIDQLSQYANIEVSSTDVTLGANPVWSLQINLISDSGEKINLVDDDKYTQFSLKTDVDTGTVSTPVAVQLTSSDGLTTTDITKDLTTGNFGGYLSMLNDAGEFTAAGTTRGLTYYENVLNKLANDFAGVMNDANTTASGTEKPLFESSDSTNTTITAANISIAKAWDTATSSYITSTKQTSSTGNSTDASNILSMISKLSASKTYTTAADNSTAGSTTLFTSSINSYMSTITNSVLALQVQDVTRQNTTYSTELDEIDTQRASVSSVDLNEEGINLIMYNQALSASSRFMTTLDDALDTIINKMGVN